MLRVVSAVFVAGFMIAAIVCVIAGRWPEGFLFAAVGLLPAALFVVQTRQ
jgi:hypothetical protein